MLVMLVLSRKVGQRIQIGDHISIVVNKVRGKRVTLGIEAPRKIPVRRGELLPRSVSESDEDQQPGEDD